MSSDICTYHRNHHPDQNSEPPRVSWWPSVVLPCSTPIPTLALGHHRSASYSYSQSHILVGILAFNCILLIIFCFSHSVCGRQVNNTQKFGWMHSWPSEQPLGARLPLSGIWTPPLLPTSLHGTVSY